MKTNFVQNRNCGCIHSTIANTLETYFHTDEARKLEKEPIKNKGPKIK